MDFAFAYHVAESLSSQFGTAYIAAGITYFCLWRRHQTLKNQAAWAVAMMIALVLVAVIPNGFHAAFPTTVAQPAFLEGAPQTTDYSVVFLADVMLTIGGSIAAKLLWAINN
ncbi:hypothetical protein [Pseudomonas sp. NA-150]|uniref:hypothetical protein n=1 Tax=Pseudomonas sp. NA-150 TaxID=3367525 RepID=UPI0037CB9F46